MMLHKNLHTLAYIILNKKIPKALIFQGFRNSLVQAPTRFELVIEVLQTFALPLGYGALVILLRIRKL